MKLQFATLLAPVSLLLAASLLVGQETKKPAEEQSVKPGINERFLEPELKVDDWLQCFEVESREAFHHFESPKGTMDSVVRALKKGGTLMTIDFERIEGKSRKWLMGHVRAGKDVFHKEIEDAGLTFVEEIEMEGFQENYFLRFRKE